MACLSHAFLMLMFSCQTASVQAESLEEVLQRNTKAMGGANAFEHIENLRFELEILEPEFTAKGTYIANREQNMRIDVHKNGKRVFAEGLTGEAAWNWTLDSGWNVSNEESAAALRHGIEAPGKFYTLEQLLDRGARVELSNPPLFARADEWQLDITLADGSRMFYFLDRNSYLPTREITRRAFHPDQDARQIPVETVFEGVLKVNGVVHFQKSESSNLLTGEWLGTTQVQSLEHNVDLPAGFFRPEMTLLSAQIQH